MGLRLYLAAALLLSCVAHKTSACAHGNVRLVNVTTEYQGTVEVCVVGRWSGMCTDRQSHQEAIVVCRQLGCEDGVRNELEQALCPDNTIKFRCGGEEKELLDCSLSDGSDCSSSNLCLNIRCSLCQARSALLPYGELVEDFCVPNVDDGSTDKLILQQPFPFFGETQRGVYVNTNGVISFNQSYTFYSPLPLPLTAFVPLILPFWIDIDISCRGKIYYRETANNETLKQAKLLLRDHRPASAFNPTSLLITTWDGVSPYQCSSSFLSNTFQAVLMTDGTISYVCFLYDGIQWGSGAQIGFDAGNGNVSFTASIGLTSATLNTENLSNINGRSGVFIYRVDGNQIISPDSQVESPTQLSTREITATSVELAWTSITHIELQEYNVYCYHSSCFYCGANLPRLDVLMTSSTSVTLSGLVPYTEYACCVTLLTSNDESDCSEEVTFRTPPVPPTAPKSVTLTNVTSTSVQLEWSRPQYSNGTLTHYTTRCSQRNHVLNNTVSNGSRVEKVTDLLPFTNYTCCVFASNQAGEGNQSCAYIRTQPAPPTEPEGITTISTGISSLTLAWRQPAKSYGQRVLFYNISCTSHLNHTVTIERVFNTSAQVMGLNSNTSYTCCVSAVSTAGLGDSVCVPVSTAAAPDTEFLDLVAAVSGGALLAALALLTIVFITTIVICCFKKRKQVNKQKREPTTDKPELHSTVPDSAYSVCYKPDNKKEVEIRYKRPVLKSTAGATAEKKEKEEHGKMTLPLQKAQPMTGQHTQHGQLQKYDQPLIPTKPYIEPAVSAEYQNLMFHSSKESRCWDESVDAAGNSEGQYEVVGRPEETNQYEPVTFGVSTSSHTDGVYQTLSKGDEINHYQDLHSMHT